MTDYSSPAKIDINPSEQYIWAQNEAALSDFKSTFDNVIDIGAHVGCFSILSALKGASKIIAVEPATVNFNRLLKNIVDNGMLGTIVPLPCAVWTTDWASMPLRKAGTDDGQFSLRYREDYASTPVPTISLKTIMEYFPRVDYLKIDIEGGEFSVVERTPEMAILMRRVQYLDLEIHNPTDQIDEQYFDLEEFKKACPTYSSAQNATAELTAFLGDIGFRDNQLIQIRPGSPVWLRSRNFFVS